MKRRNFIKAGVLGSAALASSASAQGAGRQLTMASSLPGARELADSIEILSNGRVKVVLTAVDEAAVDGALKNGSFDLSYASVGQWEAIDSSFSVFGTVPGGMTTDEVEGWFMASDGQDILDGVAQQYGVKSFLCGSVGPCPIFSKETLNEDAPFSGKSVAARGYLPTQVLNAMSAAQVSDIDAGADIGAADIVVCMTIQEAEKLGVAKSHPVMTTPGVIAPALINLASVSLSTWESLDDNEKSLLKTAIEAHHANMRLQGILARAQSYADLSAQLEQNTLSETALTDIGKTANEALLKFLDQSTAAADAADAYIFAYADMVQWSTIGPASYAVGRKKGL